MINVVANRIADWLIKEKMIEKNKYRLYEYAVYSFIFGMMPIALVLIAGEIWNIPKESLIMIIPFMLIRKFSGGYHLKSVKWCFLLSSMLLLGTCGLLKGVIRIAAIEGMFCCIILSCCSIFLLSPIDSAARRISQKEKKLFHIIACIIAIFTALIYCLFIMLGLTNVALALGMGLILSACLQIPCLLIK